MPERGEHGTAKDRHKGTEKPRQSRLAQVSNSSWLLIWVTIAVIIIWGLALSLMFEVVDYKKIYERRHAVSNITKDDLKNAMYSLYPFQYEVVRHPLKTLGHSLVAVDNTISTVLTRKQERKLRDERRTMLAPIAPVGKPYLPTPDFLLDIIEPHKYKAVGSPQTRKNIQQVFERAASAHIKASQYILAATNRKRKIKYQYVEYADSDEPLSEYEERSRDMMHPSEEHAKLAKIKSATLKRQEQTRGRKGKKMKKVLADGDQLLDKSYRDDRRKAKEQKEREEVETDESGDVEVEVRPKKDKEVKKKKKKQKKVEVFERPEPPAHDEVDDFDEDGIDIDSMMGLTDDPSPKKKVETKENVKYQQELAERQRVARNDIKQVVKDNIDSYLDTNQKIKQREAERRRKQLAAQEARRKANQPPAPPKHVFEHDENDLLLGWVNFLSSTAKKISTKIKSSAEDVMEQIRVMNAEDEDGNLPDNFVSKADQEAAIAEAARLQAERDEEMYGCDYPRAKNKSKAVSGSLFVTSRLTLGNTPIGKLYRFLPEEMPNFLEDIKYVGDIDMDDDCDGEDCNGWVHGRAPRAKLQRDRTVEDVPVAVRKETGAKEVEVKLVVKDRRAVGTVAVPAMKVSRKPVPRVKVDSQSMLVDVGNLKKIGAWQGSMILNKQAPLRTFPVLNRPTIADMPVNPSPPVESTPDDEELAPIPPRPVELVDGSKPTVATIPVNKVTQEFKGFGPTVPDPVPQPEELDAEAKQDPDEKRCQRSIDQKELDEAVSIWTKFIRFIAMEHWVNKALVEKEDEDLEIICGKFTKPNEEQTKKNSKSQTPEPAKVEKAAKLKKSKKDKKTGKPKESTKKPEKVVEVKPVKEKVESQPKPTKSVSKNPKKQALREPVQNAPVPRHLKPLVPHASSSSSDPIFLQCHKPTVPTTPVRKRPPRGPGSPSSAPGQSSRRQATTDKKRAAPTTLKSKLHRISPSDATVGRPPQGSFGAGGKVKPGKRRAAIKGDNEDSDGDADGWLSGLSWPAVELPELGWPTFISMPSFENWIPSLPQISFEWLSTAVFFDSRALLVFSISFTSLLIIGFPSSLHALIRSTDANVILQEN